MSENKILDKVQEDIEKLKSKKGYLNAGYPHFNTLFGRDSLITSWQLINYDHNIARNTLNELALFQAKKRDDKKDSMPGKILHEYRLGSFDQKKLPQWGWPYYGSVDSTSLFLIVLGKYIDASKNLEFLKKIWPSARNAVKWHINNSKNSKHGFITYNPKNHAGLQNQGWKDSSEPQVNIRPYPVALVEEQGYAYKALLSFVKMSRILSSSSDKKLSRDALMLAQKIKKNFKSQFWNDKEKYFYFGIDGLGRENDSVTSNAGHLLVCDDFLTDSQTKAVVKRLFKKDMMTLGGIRTLSAKDKNFDPFSYHSGSIWPHDNWFIYKGLLVKGYKTQAGKIKKAILNAYGELGHIPELYAVVESGRKDKIISMSRKTLYKKITTKEIVGLNPKNIANPLQAWASGAMIDMLSEK